MPFLPRRSRHVGTAGMMAPVLVTLALIYMIPVVGLFIKSFQDRNGFTLDSYLNQLTSPAFLKLLVETLELSVGVTILCLLFGYPVAYTISRVNKRSAALLLLLISLPYLTSVLIRTYAWIVVLGPNGVVNQFLMSVGLTSKPVQLVFNQIGVYTGMVQIHLPLMIFPVYAAMTKIDRSLTAAAVSLGSSPASAFWHVFAPLTYPGIVGGSTLVFLSCLGFYTTPALLGGTADYMLAQGITLRVLRLADLAGAATQATILLTIVLAVFVLLRKRFAASLDDEASAPAPLKRGDGASSEPLLYGLQRRFSTILYRFGVIVSQVRNYVLWAVTAAVMFYLIVPFLVVVPLSFSSAAYLTFPPPGYSLRWYESFFSNTKWLEATWFSLRVSVMAAIASLAVGLPAAFALARRQFALKLPAYLLIISPMVVPQIVIAIALYLIVAPHRMVGTEHVFLLAYMLLGIPYVVVVAVAGLQRFDTSLESAAASLGARPAVVLFTITLPLLMPSIVSAFLFAFIAAFDDVVFGLFLSGRDAIPLPMRMWENIRQEIDPQISVVASILLFLVIVGYLAHNTLGRLRWSRVNGR
ncbi:MULTISPECIES: ABC transporter permease subunit [unclassified Mesorhizobium]|uniref:ABC transporter permease subunit n=2 Tax=Mesorhizobium TaxID=68287 RepID=UPI001672F3AD|nr:MULTISPECIES: ABC transporter permease subunit [unclassified Mesorhizobium]